MKIEKEGIRSLTLTPVPTPCPLPHLLNRGLLHEEVAVNSRGGLYREALIMAVFVRW